MELICQDFITSKTVKKVCRDLLLFSVSFSLICLLSGCSISRTEDEEDNAQDSETAQEEPSQSAAAEEEDKPITMAKLLEDAGNGIEELPDTVLWFNATYALLTYNNGGEWRIVSGGEITEDYQKLVSLSLKSSWSIRDKESALETVKKLQQEGLDEDAIAAWDLCRVNQLYADFYVCGYMTYEEAMDASLKNSLELQKMYDSWEELVDSYMLGYQFWQSDPGLTEDSPTKQRYQCYEMLKKMEDGPYSLDWNMKLKKSW